jgi:hypothetical protein
MAIPAAIAATTPTAMPAIAPAEMPFFVVMFSPQAQDDVAEEDDVEAGDDTENDVEDVMDADGLVAVA